MKVADYRCSECGSDDVLAITPGWEPEEAQLSLFRIVTRRPVAPQCWCLPCWEKHWPKKPPGSGDGRRQFGTPPKRKD